MASMYLYSTKGYLNQIYSKWPTFNIKSVKGKVRFSIGQRWIDWLNYNQGMMNYAFPFNFKYWLTDVLILILTLLFSRITAITYLSILIKIFSKSFVTPLLQFLNSCYYMLWKVFHCSGNYAQLGTKTRPLPTLKNIYIYIKNFQWRNSDWKINLVRYLGVEHKDWEEEKSSGCFCNLMLDFVSICSSSFNKLLSLASWHQGQTLYHLHHLVSVYPAFLKSIITYHKTS